MKFSKRGFPIALVTALIISNFNGVIPNTGNTFSTIDTVSAASKKVEKVEKKEDKTPPKQETKKQELKKQEPKKQEVKNATPTKVKVEEKREVKAEKKENIPTTHWADKEIAQFKNLNIISGDSNGNMNPDKQVTRAEFYTMVSKLLNLKDMDQNVFEDLKEDDWYFASMLKSKKYGILSGSEVEGKLKSRPADKLTREEAVSILGRAFQMPEDTSDLGEYLDKNEVSSYSANHIAKFIEQGYIKGYQDNTLRPKKILTRAEAIKLIANLSESIINTKGTYENQNINGNMVISEGQVSLKNITVAKNLYITPGVGEEEIHIKDSNIKGTLFIQGGGSNSVYIENTNINQLIMDKEGQNKVRVVLKGSTQIAKLEMKREGILEKEESVQIAQQSDIKTSEATAQQKSGSPKVDSVSSATSGGRGGSGGGSSSGGSSSSGGNSGGTTKPQEPVKPSNNYVSRDKTKVVQIEGTSYLVIYLNKGSIEDYTIKVDKKTLNFGKVNTQGNIVKTEIREIPKNIEATHRDGKVENFMIGEKDEKIVLSKNDLILEGSFKESSSKKGEIEGTIKLKISDQKPGNFKVDGISGASIKGNTKSAYIGEVPAGLKASISIDPSNSKILNVNLIGTSSEPSLANRELTLKILATLIENVECDFEQIDNTIKIGLNDEKQIEIPKENSEVKAKIVEIEATKYIVIDNSKSKLKIEKIEVNNGDYEFVPVNTEKTILKAQIKGTIPTKIKLITKSETKEITIQK